MLISVNELLRVFEEDGLRGLRINRHTFQRRERKSHSLELCSRS